MRNVVKGFQFAGMAVPKTHATKVNASLTSFHAPKGPRATGVKVGRLPQHGQTPKVVRRPGKNIAIREGYKV